MEKLKEVYAGLLELDIQIKTSQGDEETLLDIFAAKVCL